MPLRPCEICGGALKRTRRTLVERLIFSEAYECDKCRHRQRVRSSSLPSIKHAHYVKCPRCHSVDLSVLRRRDGVDRMQSGLFNLLHRIGGGKLYHCWFCRLQFYDMRQRFEARAGTEPLKPPTEPEDVDLRAAS